MIRLAISSGDPLGISYEILVKSFNSLLDKKDDYFGSNTLGSIIVFGSKVEYLKVIKQLDSKLALNVITNPKQAKENRLNLIDCHDYNNKLSDIEVDKAAGYLAYKSLREAVDFTKSQSKITLLTAPVNKSRIDLVCDNFTGHTNFLKTDSNLDEVVMLFWSDLFKIITLSHHIPLKDVASKLTYATISKQMKIVSDWLEAAKIDKIVRNKARAEEGNKVAIGNHRQSFAILSINPHSGEGGLLGYEEEEMMKPAIAKINKVFSKFKVFGPFAADSFFATNQHLVYDAVFASFHDQGLIPAKLLAKKRLINQTLGLAYIRTSPSHGTAEDIAGKMTADHSNILDVIVVSLAQNMYMYGKKE